MGWKLGHQYQSTFSWHQALVKMFPCRFALLHRNTPSRGFLEAGAWLVILQPSVCYNCNLLFGVLASIKILAEGEVGIGGRRRVTICFSLAAVLRVPAPRDCGAGMQIEPARGLVCTEQPEVPVALQGLRECWGGQPRLGTSWSSSDTEQGLGV